ncbi:hypothetical protein UACE39S_05983 [Ureibacillus acetophenoni]
MYFKSEESFNDTSDGYVGFPGATAKASHLSEEHANTVLNWFENEKKGAS